MRHCVRILFTFTQPYFGTASKRSKTLAVSRYSGGSSSRPWMCTRPALRSRFRFARRVRMSLARFSASILWVSERSGAGPRSVDVSGLGGVCVDAVGTGGIYTHHRASVGPDSTEIDEIHLDLQLRSRDDYRSVALDSPDEVVTTGRSGALCSRSASSSVRTRTPAAGSRKLSVPTAMQVAPARRKSHASRPDVIPPIPTTGNAVAFATSVIWLNATARMAGPDCPPRPAPSQGCPVAG